MGLLLIAFSYFIITLCVLAFFNWIYVMTKILLKPKRGAINTTRFPLRETEIIIGCDFYSKIKSNCNDELTGLACDILDFMPHIFDDSLEGGTKFMVKYIDTQDDDNDTKKNGAHESSDKQSLGGKSRDKPVLLLLHGVPGTHEDFKHFIDEFGNEYRILVPNFPDFKFSIETNSFWHTNCERVELIRQFLLKLGVTHLKSIISHSAGSNISSVFWSHEIEITCDSLVLITPPGPAWLSPIQLYHAKRFVLTGRSPIKRNLFLAFWPDWLDQFFGVPKTLSQNTTRDDLFWITFVAVLSEFNTRLQGRLEILKQRKIPTLFVLGEKDNLLPKKKYFDLIKILGATDDHITFVDEPNVKSVRKISNDWIKVLDFKSGGHFCHIKCHSIFNQEVKQFLDQLQIKQDIRSSVIQSQDIQSQDIRLQDIHSQEKFFQDIQSQVKQSQDTRSQDIYSQENHSYDEMLQDIQSHDNNNKKSL